MKCTVLCNPNSGTCPICLIKHIVWYSYVEMLTKEEWLHLKSGELTSVGVGWKCTTHLEWRHTSNCLFHSYVHLLKMLTTQKTGTEDSDRELCGLYAHPGAIHSISGSWVVYQARPISGSWGQAVRLWGSPTPSERNWSSLIG